jgi:hypothetical protein
MKKLNEYPRHELMVLDLCLALCFSTVEMSDAVRVMITEWRKRINEAIIEHEKNELPYG